MRLTQTERKWLADMQALRDSCPSKRLGFYTMGDPAIGIYDKRKEKKIDEIMGRSRDDFCNAAEKANARAKEVLRFPSPVASTAA